MSVAISPHANVLCLSAVQSLDIRAWGRLGPSIHRELHSRMMEDGSYHPASSSHSPITYPLILYLSTSPSPTVTHPSIHPFMYASSMIIHPFINGFNEFIHPSLPLFLHHSIHPIYPFLPHLSIHLSIHLYTTHPLPSYSLNIFPSIHPTIHLSIYHSSICYPA